MEEKDFELLIMLDKTKNITHAAEKLYISQSSLSKRIATIEKELGVQLLVRTRTGILFTPSGEEVLKTAETVTEQLQRMREKIALSKHILTGHLKAGISLNYATFRLADTLSKYHDKYSQVQMHIVTGDSRDLYRDLVKGDVDLGILRGDFPWHGRKILLATEPVCAIKGLQSKNKSFNEIPYIGRKTDLAFDRDISKWMRENHVEKANNESYVDNITTCVKMVENSSGWAVVPEICLDDFKGIKEPLKFKNGQVFERPTYLMFPETVVTLPQIRTFVQFVVQENHKEVPEWLTTL